MQNNDNTPQEQSWTRAEWISTGGFVISILTLIFVAGSVWQSVQDQERRIVILETSNNRLVPMVERIDERVAFMSDLAREERGRQ